MSAQVNEAIQFERWVQYTGGNGDDVVVVFDSAVDDDDGQTLTFTVPGDEGPLQVSVDKDEIFAWNGDPLADPLDIVGTFTPAAWAQLRKPYAEPAAATVAVPGAGRTPAIALSGAQNVDVTIPALASGYTAYAVLAGTDIGDLSINSVTPVNATTVRVNVNNDSPIGIHVGGADVLVTANGVLAS